MGIEDACSSGAEDPHERGDRRNDDAKFAALQEGFNNMRNDLERLSERTNAMEEGQARIEQQMIRDRAELREQMVADKNETRTLMQTGFHTIALKMTEVGSVVAFWKMLGAGVGGMAFTILAGIALWKITGQ